MENFATHFFRRQLTCALTTLLALSLSLSSCSKKSDNPPEPLGNANVMIVHASTDAPAMDLYVNDVQKNTTPIAALSNTSYLQIEEGSKTFKLTEANKLTPTFATLSQNLRKNAYYSLFVFNRAASVENLIVEDSLTNTTAGKAFVRFVNLSPDAPAMQIARLNSDNTVGATVIPSVAYKGHTSFRELDAGTGSLVLQKTSDLSTVLTSPSYNFEAGKFYTLIAQGFVASQAADSLGVRIIANQKEQ